MNKMPAKQKPHSSHQLPVALVAGAAGFIGSHLCETLLSQNCKVYAVDNWTTGKKANLQNLLKQKNFVFIEHNLEKPFDTPIPKVDYIFHLAGVETYINGQDISLETLLVNSLGTKELLEIAKTQQAKFLLASTVDILSGQMASTDREETYSHHEAKRFSEAITFEYLNRYEINARIVRLGLIYGPMMDLASGNDLAQFLLA
ncbi:MAG: NAD-dependent epimerase/dehydratase family protein, partial [Patescibacteria group bacterium]|nr:NAD-dependent epimerase/dehydratase family protein [Patescibacteria group bacterium]